MMPSNQSILLSFYETVSLSLFLNFVEKAYIYAFNWPLLHT